MQWLGTVDSSLHSTLRTVPPTAPWIAACTALCTAPLPNLATALWAAACTAVPFPEFATALSRTAQHPAHSNPLRHHALASTLHSTLHSTFARPRHRSGQQPAQHSTMPDFVPNAAPLKSSVNNSLPAACSFCIAFARPRQPAQHAAQHVSQTLPSLRTAAPATTCTTPWTAQHLCQTSPPHCKQQPHSRPAQHPAQHLCQTSPPQSEHQPAHHPEQDHSTAPLPDFATALTAPTAACTAACTAVRHRRLHLWEVRIPIASSYLGKYKIKRNEIWIKHAALLKVWSISAPGGDSGPCGRT